MAFSKVYQEVGYPSLCHSPLSPSSLFVSTSLCTSFLLPLSPSLPFTSSFPPPRFFALPFRLSFLTHNIGVLIYVALIHMMKEEMERPEFKAGGALLYIMYAGFFIGAGCLAVIGIWA